jgi:uncharacterized membrane protein YcaP (DUF421 family)
MPFPWSAWITAPWQALVLVLASTVGIYASLILLTRVSGLRSFSKLSAFDFAITVAIGSLVGAILAMEDPPLLQGIVALAALYASQMGVAVLRQRSTLLKDIVDNEPLLLMDGREIIEENLRRGRMTEADLYAKLREANVISLDEVRAVVMETTGDVSVLHADPDGPELEDPVMENVRRPEKSEPA